MRACYEAGVSGYELYRQLRALGIECEVIAPTLTPRLSVSANIDGFGLTSDHAR